MGYVVCESGGCVYTGNTSSLWSPKKLDKEKEMGEACTPQHRQTPLKATQVGTQQQRPRAAKNK